MFKDNTDDQAPISGAEDFSATTTPATSEISLQQAPRRLATTISEAPSHRERDDSYRWVRIQINKQWRVIVCKDGIQYVVQYRKGHNNWIGKKYASRKEGVHLAVRSLVHGRTYNAVKDKIENLLI